MSSIIDIKASNVEIEIKDDAGIDSGMRITLCPASDRRVVRAEKQINDQIREGAFKRRGKGLDVDETIVTRLAAHVVGWRYEPNAQWNGQDVTELEFTEANVLAVLRHPLLRGIRDQIAEAVDNRELFTVKSQSA